MNASLFEGQLALVTGAGGGIGAAISRACAERGASLVLTARDREKLEAVRSSLPRPGEHHLVPADLTHDGELHRLCQAVLDLARKNPLGVLVLNAGAALNASIEETTVEQWDGLFAINARAPFLLVKHLLPALRANPRPGGPRIIAIGSVVSTEAYVDQGAYSASKHALYGLTRVLAKELHRDGSRIQVHSVHPGGVDTDMIRAVRPDIDGTHLIGPGEIAQIVGSLLDLQGNAMVEEVRIRRRAREPWA
ncbi:MAG: SDR family oxidoreductase [Spirochaetaceae bacterium]|nr:MAG: SDR family oxidoreductase [Spirochaetaceae bacterium]